MPFTQIKLTDLLCLRLLANFRKEWQPGAIVVAHSGMGSLGGIDDILSSHAARHS